MGSYTPSVARAVLIGAAVGAIVGLAVGLIVYAIRNSGSIVVHEVAAGLAGLVLGALIGGFYGGALNLPRGPQR